MRRKLALGTACAAVLAAGLVAAMPALSQQYQDQSRPLCRRPAALPALPPEPVAQQRQQYREAYPVPMAPPPPPPLPPPPPPSTPEAAEESGASEVTVTGSRIARPTMDSPSPVTSVGAEAGTAERSASAPPPTVSPASPPPVDYYRPRYEPQSGLLTAGDYDDLLNPELYARYVRNFLRDQNLDVPVVDTRRVLTVAVNDESGRPVPFADVTLTCADGNSLSLATMADGTAVFYPGLDRLGDRVRLTVTRGNRRFGGRAIEVADDSGAQRHAVTIAGAAAPVTKFDLLVAIDTTGSMGDEIAFLKSELRTILADLSRAHPGLDTRLSLIAYRDLGDEYVTRTFPFTRNLDSIQGSLRAQHASGGGDYPEAMDLALARAMAQQWRPDAVKSLLLVADAPPHDDKIGRTWHAADVARAKRIHIVPVTASGVADTAEYLMRAMAAATQSRYIFLTDDSGIGNLHAPPAVDCYLVTRLDRLVRRVLDSQLSGRRVEPRDGEVIRSVGRYDGGKCLLPPDWDQQQY